MANNPNLVMSAPQQQDDKAVRMRRLEGVLARFEITIADANDLAVLEDYEIVVIADDSGSMKSPALPPDQRVLGQTSATRWDELKHTVSEVVEIASCLDESGVDVFFLNREPLLGVRSASDPRLLSAFARPPAGTTPLTETLERVAARTASERPVLLFIFTDGVPNGGPAPFKQAVKKLVAPDAPFRLRVQIMACTGDDDEVGWMNALDRELFEVDVTDDYYTESREVACAGLAARFTRGDWCMKAMLGPVSKKFDAWDEATRPPPQCECSVQ